ncbi:MAG: M20/M25/M40 family metallo-hydrolase, partial [Lachnospiraceae bacterium]|nr:M20/M25/M40 family metallo-hydrolase [Lachnospiraceae bacterium]
RFINALFLVPQGVAAMSPDIEGLVQTSSNIGVVRTIDRELKFSLSVRSSLSSQKFALRDRIEAAVHSCGGTVSIRGDYPGWAFRKDSPVRETLSRVYEEQTGKKPVITAIHAGLECGLFSEALEGLDCVSIGPELKDIHSVGEKLGISSVERLYKLVTAFLERI